MLFGGKKTEKCCETPQKKCPECGLEFKESPPARCPRCNIVIPTQPCQGCKHCC